MTGPSLAEQLRRDLAARRENLRKPEIAAAPATVRPSASTAPGVHTAPPRVNVEVTAEGACFPNVDSGLGEVFTPVTPFTPPNRVGECATRKAAPAAAPRTCAGCTHRTLRKTCGEPAAAGLVPRDRFGIVWCELLPDAWARTCPAFTLKTDLRPDALQS
ncbi:MAG: hypothetical protein RLZZ182_683 [Pseudomonadota bacterium]|jgi:hypothetical protein